MKVLVNEKLSNHKYKTSEGYLICTDAILARTGKQDYLKGELFANCEDTANERISIDRPYDEVFDTKTLSSFENKPVTFDHPDEDVNISNYKSYAVGYVRDVHQGKTENGEDVIMGNLVITDKDAIEAIENGDHTDLSCGYDCEIKDENGSYYQSNIRGNHVALCEEGRAGIARIVDSKVKDASLGGVYKDYKGDIYFITSTGSGFSIFNTKGEYAEDLHWCRHVSTDGVKMAIRQGQLTKIKDSIQDSKKMTIDKAIKLTKLVKSKDARIYKIDWSAVKKDFKEFLDRRSFPYELDSTGTNAIIKVNLKTMSMSSFKKMLSVGVPDEEAINMKTSIDNNSGNTKDLLLTLAYRIGDRVYRMSDDFCSNVKSRYKVGRAKAILTVEDWKPGCFSVEIDMS